MIPTTHLQKIYESQHSIIYKGISQQSDEKVILKILNSESPTEDQRAHLANEYEMTVHLDIAGARKALHKSNEDGKPLLVLEYIDGQSLKNFIQEYPCDLPARLRIAHRIAHILGDIHQHNIIHRDINANNILINAAYDVTIIDFGLATPYTLKTEQFARPEHLEGTLPYMSPEQTGRMNRRVDYRTDLYSLGVVLYELFTQTLPFEEHDPLELIHAHLAKTPVPPDERNPDIPGALADCLVKLLAKNAEDRYQSAFGVCYDLEYIATRLYRNQDLAGFIPGTRDFSGRLCLPEKLYGRDCEIHHLVEMFEQVSRGATRVVLVSGQAGVGKSALLCELRRSVTAPKAIYLEGKFGQLRRNIPYSAILQAFTDFTHAILQESDERLRYWKECLQNAVGKTGNVLLNVVPDLELIIGPQPELPTLEGRDAQNRFNYAWGKFFKAIAQPEHPLMLIIDDFQWADSSSLDLLKNVLPDQALHHFMCIMTYRQDDVNREDLHGMETLADISLSTLHLGNLESRDVADLLHDALAQEQSQQVQQLADVVHSKTLGNAFFTTQFVKNLYQDGGLRFDFHENIWTWDLDAIKHQHITDNVVDLLAGKVRKLPRTTQELLRIAACIGTRFELNMVTAISQHDEEQTRKDIEPAIFENLVMSLERHYYQFVHEGIRHAVYAAIPDREKQAVHAQIGKLWLARLERDEVEKHLFDVVNQLQAGRDFLTQEGRQQLCDLTYRAAHKAKQASAYVQGYHYIMASRDLLPDDAWERDYDDTLRRYEELAELAYLSNHYRQTEECVGIIRQHATDIVQTVNATYTLINSYRAQSKFTDAIKAGVTLLGQLGLSIPMTPNKLVLAKEFLHTRLVIGAKSPDFFAKLPVMTDPKQLAIVKILDTLGSCVFLALPDLLPIISWKFMRIAAKYGNSIYSGSCYSGYSIILAVMNQPHKAVEFAELADTIFLRFDARHLSAKPAFLKQYIILVWTQRLHAIVPAMEEVYNMAMEAGDLEYGGYGIINAFLALYTNVPLRQLHRQQLTRLPALQKIHQSNSLRFFHLFLQTCESLMSRAQEPCAIRGEYFDEERDVRLLHESRDAANLFNFYTNKLFLCLAYEDMRFADRYNDPNLVFPGIVFAIVLTEFS